LIAAEKPDCFWFVFRCFPYGLPDISVVEVNLSVLREVKVFRPGVAVVDYELDFTICFVASPLVLAAVIYILTGDVL